MIHLLAISGSLRRQSANTSLLQALALLAPAGLGVVLEPSLGELPPFNPDLIGAEPAAVLGFRERLRGASAVVLSCPEYAHGIAGVLKNALDWAVGSGELSGKPVALYNASPRATIAQESLAEVVRTMDARLVTAAAVSLPLLGKGLSAGAIAASPEMAVALRESLRVLRAAIDAAR